jgi:NAD-dependent dihydropyrimidine dehydrogenase PreA subunit
MTIDIFENLAAALDGLANGFPRTGSNVELEILRRVFTPDEAEVAAVLTGRPAGPGEVARRAALDPAHVEATLERLAERGAVWTGRTGEVTGYRLAPFIVGFYESHMLEARDEEFARLVEEYLRGGGAVGIMSAQPAIHRVLPARGATESEWVLPYDDVRAILETAASFRLETCVCRLQQDELGTRRCDFPLESCLWFSFAESGEETGTISREAALAALDEAERVGLVHTVSNVARGIGYVCNCCGCCCGLLRGITEWGIEHSVAQANYFAEIDPATCTACGECEERCQVHAIDATVDGPRVVRRESCIGCGLCVTGCPAEAACLRRKPDDEIVPPPATRGAWERIRLKARGERETAE